MLKKKKKNLVGILVRYVCAKATGFMEQILFNTKTCMLAKKLHVNQRFQLPATFKKKKQQSKQPPFVTNNMTT